MSPSGAHAPGGVPKPCGGLCAGYRRASGRWKGIFPHTLLR